ncbi:PREDICTED: lebercilin-like protein [Gekko japonicus]|uniref:Lebercilin-like protein n=1 Tax=Gekko japonicus TaxID=146911 RepID=A0ABM1K3S6_GEKJA|nr:PREDICTED: lebercilin-like protein [Gekko japonicus]
MYSNNGITASDDCFLRFIVQDDECERHARNESLSDSPNRIYKGTQSNSCNKVNNCSKHTTQCGSGCFQLDHSNDFHANASRSASSNSSSCSERNNCGSSQKCYCEDFHTDSSGSVSSNSSRSSSSHLDQPETKKVELPKEKKENGHQAKGGKKLPKKKQQQKTSFACYSVVNSQKKNNVARRILSARLHKVKELKNEVCVLKNKLEASNMENQLLKNLQYRHLKAIAKYENAETNLPDLLEKHSREVRTLRVLLRKSQEQERNASRKLREVEIQLLKTKDAFQALQKLCEDKHLAERGELQHRLTALTERMEASDKRIQGLEKKLLLNNTSFSHQLAAEKKKTIEAQMITTNLQMEIKSLNQKIKEKERELGVRNIYANRLLKSQQDKCELESPPKGSNINKAVQADKSFKIEATTPLQKHETEKSAVLKEEKTIQDSKEKLCGVHEEAALKSEFHQFEKLPKEDTSNVTCKELLREEIHPKEEKHFRCEYLEGQKKRRDMQGLKVDILKDELEKLMGEGSLYPTQDVLKNKNNLEEALVEKKNNEECKEGGEKTAKETDHVKLAAQHKISKLKKQYVFSEVIENLHQGLPSTGPISNTSTFYNSRQVGRQQTEVKGENSVSTYEPSFGNATKIRQDTSTHSEDHTPTVSMAKKSTLMEELFGPTCILKDSHQNLKELGKGKKTLQSERIYEISSYLSDGLQCGDCKQTQIKVFHATATLEDPR